eukprot:g19372.t1
MKGWLDFVGLVFTWAALGPLYDWCPQPAPVGQTPRGNTVTIETLNARSGSTASTMQMPTGQVARSWLQCPTSIFRKAMAIAAQDTLNNGELDVLFPTRARMAIMVKVVSGYPRPLNLERFPNSGRVLLQAVQMATAQPSESLQQGVERAKQLMGLLESFSERSCWMVWFGMVQSEQTMHNEEVAIRWQEYVEANPPSDWGMGGGAGAYLGASPGRGGGGAGGRRRAPAIPEEEQWEPEEEWQHFVGGGKNGHQGGAGGGRGPGPAQGGDGRGKGDGGGGGPPGKGPKKGKKGKKSTPQRGSAASSSGSVSGSASAALSSPDGFFQAWGNFAGDPWNPDNGGFAPAYEPEDGHTYNVPGSGYENDDGQNQSGWWNNTATGAAGYGQRAPDGGRHGADRNASGPYGKSSAGKPAKGKAQKGAGVAAGQNQATSHGKGKYSSPPAASQENVWGHDETSQNPNPRYRAASTPSNASWLQHDDLLWEPADGYWDDWDEQYFPTLDPNERRRRGPRGGLPRDPPAKASAKGAAARGGGKQGFETGYDQFQRWRNGGQQQPAKGGKGSKPSAAAGAASSSRQRPDNRFHQPFGGPAPSKNSTVYDDWDRRGTAAGAKAKAKAKPVGKAGGKPTVNVDDWEEDEWEEGESLGEESDGTSDEESSELENWDTRAGKRDAPGKQRKRKRPSSPISEDSLITNSSMCTSAFMDEMFEADDHWDDDGEWLGNPGKEVEYIKERKTELLKRRKAMLEAKKRNPEKKRKKD